MTSPFVSGQALTGRNPLHGLGIVNIAIATLKGVAGIGAMIYYGRIAQAIGGWSPDEMYITIVMLAAAVIVAASGAMQFVRGLGQIGALVVPARSPADFSNYESQVLVALQRRELPAFKLPASQRYWLAHRLFPNRFPFLSERMREQLGLSIAACRRAAILTGLAVVGLWVSGFGANRVSGEIVQMTALVIACIVFAAATRVMFVSAQFTSGAPLTERDEFRLTMTGGGDPNQIPIGIEYELMSLRPPSGAPNRGARFGFAMAGGGVKNAGEYKGEVVIETQPEIIEAGPARQVALAMFVGAGLSLVATGMAVVSPSFVATAGSATGGPGLAAWLIRLIGSVVVLRAASGIIGQVEHFKSVFRFASLAVGIKAEGTYGRADIKVGKGIHDSIQSENTVVRSDSSVVGYVALIQTESVGLLGARSIVSMRGDARTGSIQQAIERWFAEFRSKGADIMGVDLQSEKVARMVQANLAISAQHGSGGAQAIVAPPAPRSLTPFTGSPTPAVTAGAASGPTDLAADERRCPECAEKIKAAARKCRFCGYRFEDG